MNNWYKAANPVQAFVSLLTEEQRKQMIKDWNQFEKEGLIGDCELRKNAELYSRFLRISSNYVVRIMTDIMFEIFRYYTEKYIASMQRL